MKPKSSAPLTCSTSEAAQALGISVRTAQLWVESGRLKAWKTPGGHRRILRDAVDQLIEQQQMPGRSPNAHLSIFLLEDKQVPRDALKTALHEQFPGCAVMAADNIFDCLLSIGEHAPDVLIADLDLLGQDNFRMLEAVNRNGNAPGMLIIVLAEAERLANAQLKLAQEFALLAKTTPPEEALRLIRAFLHGRQTHRRSR
ncbi:MAG: helix-turn-helix domain-containing protein [Rhodocyclales bacterium GT-UBC]|nr:MAG: helix-turn-helix domain-containing protein [Rhodocyclales bacterium GT-UBC]